MQMLFFQVSTLPEYAGILDMLHEKVQGPYNYRQVTPLGEDLSKNILTSWLAGANRQVTPSQQEIVQYAITKCNLPLFVRLVFDDICRWRSYSAPEVTSLASTVHESIDWLFGRIEKHHGYVLVSRAFGYLTAAKNGLSEAELEDLLSLDDQVLNDVYQVKHSYGPPRHSRALAPVLRHNSCSCCAPMNPIGSRLPSSSSSSDFHNSLSTQSHDSRLF